MQQIKKKIVKFLNSIVNYKLWSINVNKNKEVKIYGKRIKHKNQLENHNYIQLKRCSKFKRNKDTKKSDKVN